MVLGGIDGGSGLGGISRGLHTIAMNDPEFMNGIFCSKDWAISTRQRPGLAGEAIFRGFGRALVSKGLLRGVSEVQVSCGCSPSTCVKWEVCGAWQDTSASCFAEKVRASDCGNCQLQPSSCLINPLFQQIASEGGVRVYVVLPMEVMMVS